uniref:Uncharacterized protein n=1 Tax=Anguilla anguilla TaxID=7936 RepID=A0A0E9S7Q7_ANGAN
MLLKEEVPVHFFEPVVNIIRLIFRLDTTCVVRLFVLVCVSARVAGP